VLVTILEPGNLMPSSWGEDRAWRMYADPVKGGAVSRSKELFEALEQEFNEFAKKQREKGSKI